MRVFVTGGTGFIGTHVVKELQGGDNDLLLLSRHPEGSPSFNRLPHVHTVQGDLACPDTWKEEVARFRPQVAIHLAWESLPNYDARTSVRNLRCGLDLVMALAEMGCQSLVCTGSCWEYGRESGKLSEDMMPRPSNAFTATKNALHSVGMEIAREHHMHFIWTRLFYVYGPGQRETSLLPSIIGRVRKGEKPEIKTPLARNDFVYVEDVARAISAIAKKPEKDGVYNIGSGTSTSVQRVVEIVCDKLGFPYKPGAVDSSASTLAADFWADISKIRKDTGWEPQVGIEEGIKKTIDYYLDVPIQASG